MDKDLDIDGDFYVALDEVLKEKCIKDLNPTLDQIEEICKKSEGLLEIKIFGDEKHIRATKNHKFTGE